MKKFTSVIAALAVSGAAVAGPVQKEELTHREMLQLAQQQASSQAALDVQAGNWVDDYGVVVVVGVIAVAALTVGIVALAD